MDIREMKKEDFEAVPRSERFDSKCPAFDSLVIIPVDGYDNCFSRWGVMDFVG